MFAAHEGNCKRNFCFGCDEEGLDRALVCVFDSVGGHKLKQLGWLCSGSEELLYEVAYLAAEWILRCQVLDHTKIPSEMWRLYRGLSAFKSLIRSGQALKPESEGENKGKIHAVTTRLNNRGRCNFHGVAQGKKGRDIWL